MGVGQSRQGNRLVRMGERRLGRGLCECGGGGGGEANLGEGMGRLE